MFKYLSLVVYLLVILAVSGSRVSRRNSRFSYLKDQSDNVKVITYLYIIFWFSVHLLSISNFSAYLNIDDSTYSLLSGVWFINIIALVILVEK
jgi:hypothetical protein